MIPKFLVIVMLNETNLGTRREIGPKIIRFFWQVMTVQGLKQQREDR